MNPDQGTELRSGRVINSSSGTSSPIDPDMAQSCANDSDNNEASDISSQLSEIRENYEKKINELQSEFSQLKNLLMAVISKSDENNLPSSSQNSSKPTHIVGLDNRSRSWSSRRSKPFLCKDLTDASECLRRARRSYRMRCTPINEKVNIFKNSLIEKSNSWTNDRLDEINKSKNQNFWEKVSKIHKSELTNGIAPLTAENGFWFENSEKAELLRQTFFTGKHLTQMKFDDKFYDNKNKEVEQWSLQTDDEMHGCNDSLT